MIRSIRMIRRAIAADMAQLDRDVRRIEQAVNAHLNDPVYTPGLTEEDRAWVRRHQSVAARPEKEGTT
jgi:hypothetical protein